MIGDLLFQCKHNSSRCPILVVYRVMQAVAITALFQCKVFSI